jgi:hypothetical protein
LYDCFGTGSASFANQAIARLAAIMRRKGAAHPTEAELNAGLAAIDGIQPENEIEAMLAVQMVATYEIAMEMLMRAREAELMPRLQEYGSLAVKLLRTYTAQVEALARLRRGGEQRVIVQHVNVNEGGQAVAENEGQPHGRQVLGSNPIRRALPLAQSRGKEPMSDARRRRRQRRPQRRAEWELATRALYIRGRGPAASNATFAPIGS